MPTSYTPDGERVGESRIFSYTGHQLRTAMKKAEEYDRLIPKVISVENYQAFMGLTMCAEREEADRLARLCETVGYENCQSVLESRLKPCSLITPGMSRADARLVAVKNGLRDRLPASTRAALEMRRLKAESERISLRELCAAYAEEKASDGLKYATEHQPERSVEDIAKELLPTGREKWLDSECVEPDSPADSLDLFCYENVVVTPAPKSPEGTVSAVDVDEFIPPSPMDEEEDNSTDDDKAKEEGYITISDDDDPEEYVSDEILAEWTDLHEEEMRIRRELVTVLERMTSLRRRAREEADLKNRQKKVKRLQRRFRSNVRIGEDYGL